MVFIALVYSLEYHFLYFPRFLPISRSFCSLRPFSKIPHTLRLFSVFFRFLSSKEEALPLLCPACLMEEKNGHRFLLMNQDCILSIFFNLNATKEFFFRICDQMSYKYPFYFCNDFYYKLKWRIIE